MQIPNNQNNPYQKYPYPPQQPQYPQQYYPQPNPQMYNQIPPGYIQQTPNYVHPYAYNKPTPPPKKPAPFSFEPGSNKELDDALNSIDNMYSDMFDTVDNQKQKGETIDDKQQQFCIGIPIDPMMQHQQYQQYQDPAQQGNLYQDPKKWEQYNKDSNAFY